MRKLYALLAIFLAASAVSATAQTLTYCNAGIPSGLDPAQTRNEASALVTRQVYDRLVEFDVATSRVVPGIAESWVVSNRGRDYTFTLRENISFHKNDIFAPSRPLNSQDVVFSFDRQRLGGHPFFAEAERGWRGIRQAGLIDQVRSIALINNRKVRFRLRQADADFLNKLALDFGAILSAEYGVQLRRAGQKELLTQKPIGTGPFAYAGRSSAGTTRLVRFDDHWAGAANSRTLLFKNHPDPNERLARIIAGECHIAPLPANIAQGIEPEDAVRHSRIQQSTVFLAFNTSVPPFDEPARRIAASMAIDTDALVDFAFGGSAVPARSLIPPTVPFAIEAPKSVDPVAARALINSTTTPRQPATIWAPPVARSYMPDPEGAAEYLHRAFGDIGIPAVIRQPEFGSFLSETILPETSGAVLIGWEGPFGNAEGFIEPLLTCDRVGRGNRSQWCDEGFESLLAKARSTNDPATRRTLFAAMQEAISEAAPLIPLAHPIRYAATARGVTNFRIPAFGPVRLKDVKPPE